MADGLHMWFKGLKGGGGGVCRVGGSVGQVQVVRVACLTGSQRKGLSGISPDMVLEGWSASLRLLVLVDTRRPDLRGRAACCWMVCSGG